MIKGYDISHHNIYNYRSITDADFIMIKATEGISFSDFAMTTYANYFHNIPKGFYHYAHPEKNGAEIEAYHFIKKITDNKMLPAVLALDWEDKALKCPIKWALDWLNFVKANTGIKPLLYVQRSYVKNCSIILERDYGLWVASPSKKPTIKEISPYKYFAIWQSKKENGIDTDYFNGTVEQFKKYGNIK